MAAEIVAHGGAFLLRHFAQILQGLDDRDLGDLRPPFGHRVDAVHIGLMMTRVMDLHGHGVDMRFERVIGIAEFRQMEGAAGGGRRGGRGCRGLCLCCARQQRLGESQRRGADGRLEEGATRIHGDVSSRIAG